MAYCGVDSPIPKATHEMHSLWGNLCFNQENAANKCSLTLVPQHNPASCASSVSGTCRDLRKVLSSCVPNKLRSLALKTYLTALSIKQLPRTVPAVSPLPAVPEGLLHSKVKLFCVASKAHRHVVRRSNVQWQFISSNFHRVLVCFDLAAPELLL